MFIIKRAAGTDETPLGAVPRGGGVFKLTIVAKLVTIVTT